MLPQLLLSTSILVLGFAAHGMCESPPQDVMDSYFYVHKIFQKFSGNNQSMTVEDFKTFLSQIKLSTMPEMSSRDDKRRDNQSYSNASFDPTAESLYHNDPLHKCLVLPFNNTAEISPAQFSALCPALLFHLDTNECDYHHHSELPSAMTWLYATLSISVISLSGLLAVSIIPAMQRVFYQSLLQFLVGLAIGSLSGDALLHLLPHAMTHHGSDDHNHDIQVWRGVAALGGAYLFFITERILNIATSCHGHSHHVKTSASTSVSARKALSNSSLTKESEHSRAVGEKLSHHSYAYPVEAPALESLQSLNPECCDSDLCGEKEDGLSPACDCSKGEDVEWDNQTLQVDLPYLPAKTEKQSVPTTVDECHRDTLIFRHDETDHSYVVTVTDHHHHHAHSNSVSSVGIMVIIGDAMHNFCDGLAIGAAFAADISGGISTALAVFCHELPHELGDFAMLLKSGLSVRRALLYNGVSSLLCFLGMIIGLLLGNIHSSLGWIFAAASGMFLYIAFVDMVPELSVGPPNAAHNLALQFVGVFIGVVIMLIIALYEHELQHIVS